MHKKRFPNQKAEKRRRLKNANPKESLKIINSTKKPNNIHATLEDLYSFYKKANLNHTNENVDTQQNDETEVLSNEQINENEINQPITEDEIIMAVKSPKTIKREELIIL